MYCYNQYLIEAPNTTICFFVWDTIPFGRAD